ncbi:MAG: hypothetical protein ACREPD_05040 [Stenotrophomonas sp.]|uniref:hypothetical protein n=1 Tax=Stenotrophomonas sp. TaxID=69392 RepID=UPI003D6D15C2
MSSRIYDRPDLDQRQRLLALLVVGNLPAALPMLAYEGRLQIYNAVGACTVRQIDGDKLPPGHRLYVDQATREVVVAWPAYQAGAAPIVNPGFESGPTGWQGGSGWSVTTLGPITGQWAGEYATNRGEAVLSNTARYEVYPGQRTNAKCKVRQGATAEGNAGASVLLEYRDADGVVVSTQEGNRVMSATKGAVYDSKVLGTAPAGAATVNIASNGIRYRENKPLFVDDFEWDHTVAAVGLDHDAEFRLTLQVTDSAGRSAIWRGAIGDQPFYFTSRPYPIVAPPDCYAVGLGIVGVQVRTQPAYEYVEAYTVGLRVSAVDIREPVKAYVAPVEAYLATLAVTAIEIRNIVKATEGLPEAYGATLAINAIDIKQVLISQNQPVEAYGATLAITGVTIS